MSYNCFIILTVTWPEKNSNQTEGAYLCKGLVIPIFCTFLLMYIVWRPCDFLLIIVKMIDGRRSKLIFAQSHDVKYSCYSIDPTI